MNADPKEAAFQQDIIDQMVAGGWKLGDPAKYDRKLALYTDDCLKYVKMTQPKTWEKYQKLYPAGSVAARTARQVGVVQNVPVQTRAGLQPVDVDRE